MPTTPIFGWPYQSLTGTPDGPNLGEDLALAQEVTVAAIAADVATVTAAAALTTADVATLKARYGARVRRAAVQSIPNVTATAITFDTEDEDTAGFLAVPSSTLTIPSDAIYSITYYVSGPSTASARTYAEMLINSSLTGLGSITVRSNQTSGESVHADNTTGHLTTGDTVQLRVFHSMGVAADFTAWLQIWRVSP